MKKMVAMIVVIAAVGAWAEQGTLPLKCAWINEINMFDGDMGDEFHQYIEVAVPQGFDMTGWHLQYISFHDSYIEQLATFGYGGVVSIKTENCTNGYAFIAIQSPKTKEADSYPGLDDGTWNVVAFNNGVLNVLKPYAVQLVRPNGLIEHEVVFMCTNTSTSRMAFVYDGTNFLKELSATFPEDDWIYAGADPNVGSLGVFAGEGELPICWTNSMVQTPGGVNLLSSGMQQYIGSVDHVVDHASTQKVGDYTWTYLINGENAEIIKGVATPAILPRPTGAVTVPLTLGGKPVTSIGTCAFYGCSGLTSVTIPSSVTSIGSYAFYGCSGLTSVTIPNSVTSIGSQAFHGCSNVREVTVPGWQCEIPFGNVTNLVISAGTTSISAGAFKGCGGLMSVMIPNSVTNIGSSAFSGCSGLARLTIPDGVANIWNGAFSGLGIIIHYRGEDYPSEIFDDLGKITIVTKIRESDPTILDVFYCVKSSNSTVRVRALAFEDGVRSFSKVVRPETFVASISGNATAQNIGDSVEPNVPHTLSWKVSADWAIRLAKVQFEILASEDDLLPLELRAIPASSQYGKMKISWNAISTSQVFDALLWLYADKDPGLTLVGGVLRNDSTQLASGTELSNPNATRYIYSKMGYQLLTGAPLNYANSETRLGLSPSGVRQYAYKIVEE